MEYLYDTEFTCAKQIQLEVSDGDVVRNVKFLGGGCDGNLKAVPRLVEGKTVDEIVELLGGITCGRRPTSCADQLTKAVLVAREAYHS